MVQTTHQDVQRGRVLFGTVLAQLGLGTVYSWSIFNVPLANQFFGPAKVLADKNISFGIAVTFSIMMICLSVSTLSIGWLQAKFGVRKVLVTTGIGLGVGLLVSAFATNVWVLYIFAGVLVGASDGIGYLLSLTNVLRLYPDKGGVVSGISVGAYGVPAIALPFVLNPLIATTGTHVARTAFIVWAIIAFVLVVGGGLLLKDAPTTAKVGVTPGEYSVKQMLHTPQSYLLYIALTTVCFAGLYIIGNAGNGAKLAVPALATGVITLVSLVGLVNTLGRFFFGWLSDHVKRTLIVAVALAVLAVFAFILGFTWVPAPWLFILGFLLFGAAFGGCITIYPTIVGDFYGHNNQSKNYSVIYQGFATGALITLIFNALHVPFNVSFPIGGVIIAIGAVILFSIKAPKPLQLETPAAAPAK